MLVILIAVLRTEYLFVMVCRSDMFVVVLSISVVGQLQVIGLIISYS